jgi:hypothetical protein
MCVFTIVIKYLSKQLWVKLGYMLKLYSNYSLNFAQKSAASDYFRVSKDEKLYTYLELLWLNEIVLLR